MRGFGWDRLETALLAGNLSANLKEVRAGDSSNNLEIVDGVVTLSGTAKRKFHTRPSIDVMHQIAHQLPTEKEVGGIYKGFSFPLYGNDSEELFLSDHVPHRWDGESDITIRVLTALAGSEGVSDGFRFKLMWNHTAIGSPVPASGTSHAVNVEQEISTGRNAEYDQYLLSFTLDYDVDGSGNEVADGELLGMRLYRIGVTSAVTEASNEIVVLDWLCEWQTDKMYGEGD